MPTPWRSCRCGRSIALRPVAHVRANGVEIGADRLLSDVSQAAGRAIATTLLSAEAVGLARWATDTASEYAKIREQFGRPIGQFQAIKHKCAEMIATTERATAAVWDAVRAIDEAAETDWDNEATHYEFAAAVAATLAPAAAQRCTQDCIQVHGGIGFTWEHDTNVYYRHTLGLVAAFGRSHDYPQRVFDTATTTGMRPLDIDLDPDTEKLRERDPRRSGCAESDSGRRAQGGHRRGRLGAALPASAVGSGRDPGGADHHLPGVQHRTGQAAGDGHRRLADPVDRGLRDRRAEATVPASHLPRRNDLVPAVFRAGRRFGPGQPDHQGHQGRRRLAHHRAEDLDHRRTVLPVGRTAGKNGPKRSETQWHHLLPARHEAARRRGQAASRTDRQRVVQHRLHRRRLRARRIGARPGGPRLGGQPQYPDRRTGFDRQRRAVVPAEPAPSSSSSSATGQLRPGRAITGPAS